MSQSIFRMPVIWGGLAYLGFYALINLGVFASPEVDRYFNSHLVEHITTLLFFVGLAALMIKACDLMVEFSGLDSVLLGPAPPDGQPVGEAKTLMVQVAKLPPRLRNSYLGRRLRDSLEFLHRKGAAETLDDQLHHLADADFDRMQSSYALTRIIIWAIPILGFLGTVIGITLAIAKLTPKALETSLPEVTGGLGIAFDTTALALALSMVLMFVKFFVERMELQLLSAVDDRMSSLLVGRFQEFGAGTDPNAATVRRMAEAVVRTTESLVERQAELWNATIEEANTRWSTLASTAGEQLETALTGALAGSLERHAESLLHGEEAIASENRRHWDRLHAMLVQSSEVVAGQHAEIVKQGDVLHEVVQAMGQIQQLEASLNNNLAALAGSRNFEETVVSLSATLQLLSTRLGQDPAPGTRVELPSGAPTSSAA